MDMLLQWCENEHLEWNKKEKIAYGYYENFPICVKSNKQDYLLCIFCAGNAVFEPESKYVYDSGRLTTSVPHENGASLMYIAAAVNRLCRSAREAGLEPSACTRCRGSEHLRVWRANEEYTLLCINCRQALDDEKQDGAQQANELMPTSQNIIGAIIGAILGVIFYSIVYQLGNFAPLAGAGTALFIAAGYSKGGGSFSMRSFRFCSLIGVLSLMLAQISALWLTLYISNFLQGVSPWQAMEFLPRFLNMEGVLRAALSDILLAAVPLMLILFWWYLRARKKRQ